MIFFIIIIIVVYVLYRIILKPLIPLLILKLQFGKQAYLWYAPIWGLLKYNFRSLKQNGDFFDDLRKRMRQNPKVKMLLTNFLDKPFINFVDSEYVKKMYLDHQNFPKFNLLRYDNLIDKGLLMAEGEEWKHQRNLLGSAFTFEKLKSRIPMINQIVKERCILDPKTNSFDFISWITGEVVIHSFFGEIAKGLIINGKPGQVEIVNLVADIMLQRFKNTYTQIKLMILGNKGWRILATKKEKDINNRVDMLRNTVKQLIEKRLEQLQVENQREKQKDQFFLDIYLNELLKQQQDNERNKINIDLENVLQQFLTLFFAGTDTTATMTITCLVYLAKYPDIQNELLQEIQDLIQDQDVQDNHLTKFVKMNAFINEVFRLRNPAFSPFVRLVQKDMQFLDIKLKKGWMVVQRHDIPVIRHEHFSNPEEFDYKRWLINQGNIQSDNGFVHIPFGAGGRNCIGQHMALMELKIILCHIIRKFQVSLNPDVQIKFGIRFLYGAEPENCLIYKERR
ncbi:unnamed protein product [Paramecium pentaurelia]|uniref:Cytochrome P450 n=1 Tax=Paramecium pentaurelia TaxID=43138 RepID=A0A8S1XWK8_9CILI|nr:unnamed protein product [Paramecium pentaurelia]